MAENGVKKMQPEKYTQVYKHTHGQNGYKSKIDWYGPLTISEMLLRCYRMYHMSYSSLPLELIICDQHHLATQANILQSK